MTYQVINATTWIGELPEHVEVAAEARARLLIAEHVAKPTREKGDGPQVEPPEAIDPEQRPTDSKA